MFSVDSYINVQYNCCCLGKVFCCALRDFTLYLIFTKLVRYSLKANVPDPDPHVFGPPEIGSSSISQIYGSGSFYHQAKKVRKTLIPTVFWLLLDFLSLKNDIYVSSKSNKQKNFFFIRFLLVSWRSMTKIIGSGSVSQRHGSADPDPDQHQNVMDP